MSDPTNGFFALRSNALQLLNFHLLDARYFFEISLLIQLNVADDEIARRRDGSVVARAYDPNRPAGDARTSDNVLQVGEDTRRDCAA